VTGGLNSERQHLVYVGMNYPALFIKMFGSGKKGGYPVTNRRGPREICGKIPSR